jgi:hypothetical protein
MLRPKVAVFVLAMAIWVRPTHAQVSQAETSAASQALFDQGRALLDQGKNEQACSLLEESQRIDPASGTQFWLATCYTRLGKLASAWALFIDVASQERAKGSKDREALARDKADEIKARISYVTIQVAEPHAPGLSVVRNGSEVQSAQFGLSIPVDPGAQEIQASAPGYTPFRAVVQVAPESGVNKIIIPVLSPGAEGEVPALGPVPAENTESDPKPEESSDSKRKGVRPLVLLEGVLSAGGGVVSTSFYDPQGYGITAMGAAIAGGVVLGPGFTVDARVRYDHFWFFDSSGNADANAWGLMPQIGWTFTHADPKKHTHLLFGGGFEHFPKSEWVIPAFQFSYTYAPHYFLFGIAADLLTGSKDGVSETDFFLSLRFGVPLFP